MRRHKEARENSKHTEHIFLVIGNSFNESVRALQDQIYYSYFLLLEIMYY